MAAPVVSGTIALMLQANPSLTPNLIKAILQYTAQPYAGYKPLQQGAGFLNTLGAVRLARFYPANAAGSKMPVQASLGPTHHLGQSPHLRRLPEPARQRLGEQHHLGSSQRDDERRQHRLGHPRG